MAEVLFRAKLIRDESNSPWGFRLQGGADYGKPLTLLKVQPESVAAKSGLHAGDIVVKMGGQSADGMTHKAAQDAIMKSGNTLEIIVERNEETISSPNATGSTSPPLFGELGEDAEHPVENQESKEQEVVSGEMEAVDQQMPSSEKTTEPEKAEDPDKVKLDSKNEVSEAGANGGLIPTGKHIPSELDESSASALSSSESGDENTSVQISTDKLNSETNDSEQKNVLVQEEKLLTTAGETKSVRTRTRSETNGGNSSNSVPWRNSNKSSKGVTNENNPAESNSETKVKEIPVQTISNSEPISELKPTNGNEIPVKIIETSHANHVTIDEPTSTSVTVTHSVNSSQDLKAPWRRSGENYDPSVNNDNTDNKHPWRRNRKSGHSSSEYDNFNESADENDNGREAQSSLTFVGRRIESSNSPYGVITFGPSSAAITPSIELTPPQSDGSPASTLSSTCSSMGSDEDYRSPGPDDIYFSSSDPDLVDIPMPAVRQMVADLNRRLEIIAAQQPEITQPLTSQELGLNYYGKNEDGLSTQALRERLGELEHEIMIDSPPFTGINTTPGTSVSLSEFKRRYFGGIPSDLEAANFQKIYDITSPLSSPPPRRRQFVISNAERSPSPRGTSRKVTFAEPPAQSVIEIESRKPRRRERQDDVAEQAALSFQERLEKEPITQTPKTGMDWRANAQALCDSYIPRSQNVTLLSSDQGGIQAGAHQGAHPGAPQGIRISITTNKGEGADPKSFSFQLPQGAPGSRYSYSISSSSQRGGGGKEPFSISYSFPPSYEESLKISTAGGANRYPMDSPKTYHFQYPLRPSSPTNLGGMHYMGPGNPNTGQQLHINTSPRNLSPRSLSPVQGGSSPSSYFSPTGGAGSPTFWNHVRPNTGYDSPNRGSPIMTQHSGYLNPNLTPGYNRSFHMSPTQAPPPPQAQVQPKGLPKNPQPPWPLVQTPPRATVPRPGYLQGIRNQAMPSPRLPQGNSFQNLQHRLSDGEPQAMAAQRTFLPPASATTELSIDPPAMRAVVPPQSPLSPPLDVYSSPRAASIFDTAPGLFALFDKSFTDKFLDWQHEFGGGGDRPSETMRLVREMDNTKFRGTPPK